MIKLCYLLFATPVPNAKVGKGYSMNIQEEG
jgi:hypothetical protein